MKFKGTPNQLVRITKIRRNLIRKVPKTIRFDNEGIYETESPYLIKRLLVKFEQVEEAKIEEATINDEIKTNCKDMSYKSLQKLYVDKTGKTAVGVSKANIIKELEG